MKISNIIFILGLINLVMMLIVIYNGLYSLPLLITSIGLLLTGFYGMFKGLELEFGRME